MNAPLPHPFVAQPDWPAMQAAADVWRGQCVDQFTRAESHVGEALLRLRSDRAEAVRLDHLAGQRSAELERLLADRTDAPAQRVVKALQGFRAHERLRTFLCHGLITVLAEQAGDWHLCLRVLEFRKDEPKRDILYLAQNELNLALGAVRRDCQRLGDLLANLAAG